MCYKCAARDVLVMENPTGNVLHANLRETFIAIAINIPNADDRVRLAERYSDLLADTADTAGAVSTVPKYQQDPELLRTDERERLLRDVAYALAHAEPNVPAGERTLMERRQFKRTTQSSFFIALISGMAIMMLIVFEALRMMDLSWLQAFVKAL